MRARKKLVENLEALYREGFQRAEKEGDRAIMAKLDHDFQRDQLYMEVLLDIRELLADMGSPRGEEGGTTSLLEKAQAIRRLTKLK